MESQYLAGMLALVNLDPLTMHSHSKTWRGILWRKAHVSVVLHYLDEYARPIPAEVTQGSLQVQSIVEAHRTYSKSRCLRDSSHSLTLKCQLSQAPRLVVAGGVLTSRCLKSGPLILLLPQLPKLQMLLLTLRGDIRCTFLQKS